MSNQIFKENLCYKNDNTKIRLELEPIDIEVDENDGTILLAELQSAIPSLTGIYYRSNDGNDNYYINNSNINNDKSIKCAVKFDGRKFYPPKNVKCFFVTLGSSTKSFPVQSYENATKQFQHSVALVQSLMSNVSLPAKQQLISSKLITNNQMEKKLNYNLNENFNQTNLINEKMESNESNNLTEKNYKITIENNIKYIKELELQFSNLSQIINGKDEIITNLRKEKDLLTNEINLIKQKLKISENQNFELNCKFTHQEDELNLFRTMNKEQDNMCQEIDYMIKKSTELKLQNKQKIANLETKIEEQILVIENLRKKIEEQSTENSDNKLQFLKCEKNCIILQTQNSVLQQKLIEQNEEFSKQIKQGEKYQKEILADNVQLHNKNNELQKQNEKNKLQLTEIECIDFFKQKLTNNKMENKELTDKLLSLIYNNSTLPINLKDALFSYTQI